MAQFSTTTGMAHIDAAGRNAQGKATWVIAGDHTTIRDVELSGSAVPDNNGAGIRQEGANLTVIGCYFHDNQDGILAGDNPTSDIVMRGLRVRPQRRRRRLLAQHVHQPRAQLHAGRLVVARRTRRAPGQVASAGQPHPVQPDHRPGAAPTATRSTCPTAVCPM